MRQKSVTLHTTYLAVVADIAVRADGGGERVHAFLSVARRRAHTHKTDVCNRRFNVWSWAKTDPTLGPVTGFQIFSSRS